MTRSLASRGRRGGGRRYVLLVAAAIGAPLGAAAGAAADPPADTIFGYEAATNNARILEYAIDKRTSTTTFRRACVPNPGVGANGRGIALGERQGPDQPRPGGMKSQTRVLFNTFIRQLDREGDGFIHRNELPSRGCTPLAPIPFGEGAGPPNQDSIGALDFDETDDHSRGKGQDPDILYAAGYRPVGPTGFGNEGPFQFLYKLNAETGEILGRCQAPRRTARPGSGNDTLAFARLNIGGETHEVLLTDFGEFRGELTPDSLAAVDVESLTGPLAPQPGAPCRILAEFPVYASNGGPGTGTGIDYEKIPKPPGETGPPDSLVVTKINPGAFFDANQPPFNPARPMGSSAPANEVEDITVNRVNPPEDR